MRTKAGARCHAAEPLVTPICKKPKKYEDDSISGFRVKAERGVFEAFPQLRSTFEADLERISQLLPRRAWDKLRATTCFWINQSHTFGPSSCRVEGRGSCFHPSKEWLLEQGELPEKAQGIEIYSAHDFLDWHAEQPLMLLHELAHAWHFQSPEGGFDRPDVIAAYDQAMASGLYDLVEMRCLYGCGGKGITSSSSSDNLDEDDSEWTVVQRSRRSRRGRDKAPSSLKMAASEGTKSSRGCSGCGRFRPAYACMDQMEYFAELSVAFFSEAVNEHFGNKWFPFCRAELEKHDAHGFAVCQLVWHDYDEIEK